MQRLVERKLDLIITNVVSSETPAHLHKRIFTEPSILMLPKNLKRKKIKLGVGKDLPLADCR